MIIEPGALLFHGTGEEFPEQEFRPGSDNILWTAKTSDIAQNYIPISGSSMIIAPQYINRPDDSHQVQALQRYLGIEYDYNKVTRDQYDRINGWLLPKGWDHTPTEKDVKNLLDTKGFPNYGNHSYEIHTEFGDIGEVGRKQIIILPPGGKIIGRLFIIQVKEPLNIYDMTQGEELEGDLMEPDYNKFSSFTKIYKEGFDGVKINDFAQSKKWGNINHLSIGLFDRGLLKCQWISIPATNFDWDDLTPTVTPEYAAWQKSQLRGNPFPQNYRPPYLDINIEPLDLIDDALIDILKAVSYLSRELPLYAATKLMNAAHRIRRCGETSDDWHTILFVVYARLSFLVELVETQSLTEVSLLIQEIVALLYSIITNEPYLQKLNSQTKVERIFDLLRKT